MPFGPLGESRRPYTNILNLTGVANQTIDIVDENGLPAALKSVTFLLDLDVSSARAVLRFHDGSRAAGDAGWVGYQGTDADWAPGQSVLEPFAGKNTEEWEKQMVRRVIGDTVGAGVARVIIKGQYM